jgi:molybdenum cofactor cytidylyltransferase
MISAVILAAGKSSRMGRPKMLLPWKDTSILGHIISVFRHGGVEDVLVVTGRVQEEVERIVVQYGARSVYNTEFASGEMLSSLQCGIRALPAETEAALVGLGDQPQVREGTVRMICDAFRERGSAIVVPSFQMRRGHPWLVARTLWDEILEMRISQTPRDFLNEHAHAIHYVNVEDPNILADLDTPEEYRKSRTDDSR